MKKAHIILLCFVFVNVFFLFDGLILFLSFWDKVSLALYLAISALSAGQNIRLRAGVLMYSVQWGNRCRCLNTSQWHCHCLESTDSSMKFTSVLLMGGGLYVAIWFPEIPGESLYNMASCDVTMVSSG